MTSAFPPRLVQKGKDVLVALPAVRHLVDHFMDKENAQAAQFAVADIRLDIGAGFSAAVKWYACINYLNKGRVAADLAVDFDIPGALRIRVAADIDQHLLHRELY